MSKNITPRNVLVIGASGGIATACLSYLASIAEVESITAVSRSALSFESEKITAVQLSEQTEAAIMACCDKFPNNHFDLVISTLGVLHDESIALNPEKKLEDISEQALSHYFKVNSILPALWLRGLVSKVNKKHSQIVMLSARVGSISDNKLGGWYGYRASKSALNMLLKTAQIEYQRRASGCTLVAYHPGTVDTQLSEPFQRNVKPEKLFTPEFTVECLFEALNNLPDSPPPLYIDWQNKSINW